MGARPHQRTPGSRGAGLLLLFLALTLVVINLSNWFILSRVTASVDEELGLRLTTVASAAITTATEELLLAPGVADDAFVRRVLRDLASRHELENVFLVDPDGVMLFDLAGESVGERNPFLDLDFVAFTKALAGIPAASPSLDADGVVLKAAYAPVEDWDGTVEAVLGVTAGGGFFARVPALKGTLIGVSVGSVALIVVLGAAFFGMSRRLGKTEAALSQSETLSAMGMLAAGVAHEVRNPLAIISGAAERLKRKYGAGVDEPLFDFIPEEVERLNAILEGYLRFARDEPLAFSPCDLRQIAERTLRLAADELADGSVEVAPVSGPSELLLQADPQRLQQVLLNLLLNAAQAMEAGGRIEVELEARAGVAIVRMGDSGPGFREKELKQALQPFYTTKEKGSGLGLAMARRIVEAHGGVIRLGNRPEGGALVTVELPVEGPGKRSGEVARESTGSANTGALAGRANVERAGE